MVCQNIKPWELAWSTDLRIMPNIEDFRGTEKGYEFYDIFMAWDSVMRNS